MYDVIVIGAGPAGLNSALYALRSGKTVLIIEANAVGGQIANSPKVENFPTIKEISGSEFADKFLEQVEGWGGELEYDRVTKVEKIDNIFKVTTEYGEFESKAVIAAVGVEHKHISVPGESELLGKGVYYCALCDGPFYAGKEVALIGDGNTAMQYALVLSNICSKVYLLTWMDKFFGDKVLEKTVRERENIVHMPETSVTAFNGSGKLESISYTHKLSGESRELHVPAVFVAIGQVPANGIFEQFANLDNNGYFIQNGDMSTKTPGFFVAGDACIKGVRQLATAISDGAVAAVSACTYIDSMENLNK